MDNKPMINQFQNRGGEVWILEENGEFREMYSSEIISKLLAAQPEIERLKKENKNLRDSLINAKGWILANTNLSCHQLIENINKTLEQK